MELATEMRIATVVFPTYFMTMLPYVFIYMHII